MSRIVPRPPEPGIDAGAIGRFCDLVFGQFDGFVPVRALAETGTPSKRPLTECPPVNALAGKLVALAASAARDQRGLYVVPGTVTTPGRARAEDIRQTTVLLVDLDAGDISAKRYHLVRYLGQPSLEVASGGITPEGAAKLHLYWKLTRPAEGDDLGCVARLREAMARKAGGDPHFASLHQPIRVPGSIHGKNGHPTEVRIVAQSDRQYGLDDLATAIDAMPVLPGLAVQEGTRKAGRKGLTPPELMTRSVHADAGDGITRFDALSMIIGHWVRTVRTGRTTHAEAWEAVRGHNAALIRPPWDEIRLRREFDSLLARDLETHGPMPAGLGGAGTDAAGAPPPCSEDALAAAFAAAQGARWRHVAPWNAWMHWTDTHWQKDETAAVSEAVRQICRAAAVAQDQPPFARRIASAKTIRSVVAIAAADPALAVRVADWDVHPMLLNTPAGIVDLVTGEVRAHDPSLLLTQRAGASPGEACPGWREFLKEITGGDSDLQAYLARLAGYCLTGSTREQVFAFLHGNGANGKSVFLDTLAAVLGDYAATAPLETFMASAPDRHPTDLAGLRAARLVLVTETEPGRAWAETRIKTVTGGNAVRARFMNRDFFEFRPQFKLIVAGNHRPALANVGEAMRRRLHLVPFAVTIPPGRRDQQLAEKLRQERDGILGWMLAGCAEWQRIGLAPPACVLTAAADYFEGEDLVGQWITECCTTAVGLSAPSVALYRSWSGWAEAGGHPVGSSKALGEALRERGFMATKVAGARGWKGIALRAGRAPAGERP